MQTTVTEALAELKIIKDRLPKVTQRLEPYLLRPEQMNDPLIKTGGSEKFVASELQSARDLLVRLATIRSAISSSNQKTMLTVDGETHSVAYWLVWKNEVYEPYKSMLNQVYTVINRTRDQNRGVRAPNGEFVQVAWVVNLSEKDLLAELQHLDTIYGVLDGKLSILNATTLIDL